LAAKSSPGKKALSLSAESILYDASKYVSERAETLIYRSQVNITHHLELLNSARSLFVRWSIGAVAACRAAAALSAAVRLHLTVRRPLVGGTGTELG